MKTIKKNVYNISQRKKTKQDLSMRTPNKTQKYGKKIERMKNKNANS
jgi:hypothetical protein